MQRMMQIRADYGLPKICVYLHHPQYPLGMSLTNRHLDFPKRLLYLLILGAFVSGAPVG
jgi:hypothetical protein